MLYFEILPSELSNIIFSYLDYNDLIDLDDIMKVNYEELFRIRYPNDYKNFKVLFQKDETMRIYRKMWELFYLEFTVNSNTNSITDNIKYSSLLLIEYPQFYKYKKIFKNIGIENNSLSYELWFILNYLKEHLYNDSNKNFEGIEHIKKFYEGKQITEEEYDNVTLDPGFVPSPELFGFMMLEGDFLPQGCKQDFLKSIEYFLDEASRDEYYFDMTTLFRHYENILR